MQFRVTAVAAISILVGCSPPPADIVTEAPVIDPHAPPIPSDEPVTAEFLIGAWGDNGDCNSTITYNADGSFRMQDGSTGTWTLEGDRVTMIGERGDFAVQIAKGNDNQLLIGQPDGSFGISQRC